MVKNNNNGAEQMTREQIKAVMQKAQANAVKYGYDWASAAKAISAAVPADKRNDVSAIEAAMLSVVVRGSAQYADVSVVDLAKK